MASTSPNLVVRQNSDSGGGVPNEMHTEEVSAFAIDDDDEERTLKSADIEKKPDISKQLFNDDDEEEKKEMPFEKFSKR